MMKSLRIIQTLSKMGMIFSKIVCICCIIGAVGCAVGMAGLSFADAAHNNFDQAVFGTITRGADKMYFVSETGMLTILCAWTLAVVLYCHARKQSTCDGVLQW